MRILLIPFLGFACIGAHGDGDIQTLRPEPELIVGDGITTVDRLLHGKGSVVIGDGEMKDRQDYLRANCRDMLEHTKSREPSLVISEKPLFQREPATPHEPLAIYAVDRREDGCGMMVMLGNPDDVRPLPITNPDDYRVMYADEDGASGN